MNNSLFIQLEQKITYAVEAIALLRMQVEELEAENTLLKSEKQKWQNDLLALLKHFDPMETAEKAPVSFSVID